jgi:rhodanese-related sulfurtransferase
LKVALEAGENIIVIDARSSAAYLIEHLSGAINIAHRKMNEETTKGLDRTALVAA